MAEILKSLQRKKSQGILSLIGTEGDDIEKALPGAPGSSEYIYQQTAKRRDREKWFPSFEQLGSGNKV